VSRDHAADVAIYAPNAAPLYLEGGGRVAGAERQAGFLAAALAADGLRVRHIIRPMPERRLRDDGPVEPIVLDLDPDDRGVARYRGIVSTLRAADARVYIQACASHETGIVGAWSRLHGRRFVFQSTHDADFVTDVATLRMTAGGLYLRRVMFQYRIGLIAADRVVVLTEAQRELARRAFGIDDAVFVPYFAEVPPQHVGGQREAFLWVGGLIEGKDPLAYLELARRIPEARFWMVGTDRFGSDEVAARVRSEAPNVENLELFPPMSSDDILGLYERAVAVVSTSVIEGFPNVFLEGWARGCPVLSLRVDPDRVIETHGLGTICHGSFDELAAATRRLWAERETIDPKPYRAYVERFHDPDAVAAKWVALVRELLDA
jgi:glycosyltransferase involved in cell wall biosynthesis